MILYITNALFGLPYPPDLIFRLLITPVPGSIESVLVETFGELPKYATFVLASAIYALLYGAISIFVGFLFNRKQLAVGRPLTLVATAIPTSACLSEGASLTPSPVIPTI
jgi:hypothetical protein